MSTTENVQQLRWPGYERQMPKPWMAFTNKVLAKLRLPFMVKPRFDHLEDMVAPEQVANFELLIGEVLDLKVPGDFVELGCYTGSTAAVFAQLIKRHDPSRVLYVFDRFDIKIGSKRNIRELFESNLRQFAVPLPVIHQGDFSDTVPACLPERIAFAHVDCGHGGDVQQHAALITHCLNGLYPRLSPGAVVVFMDYHVPGTTWFGNDSNPGVRIACDAFFADKSESLHLLYGGACSHACVRKA